MILEVFSSFNSSLFQWHCPHVTERCISCEGKIFLFNFHSLWALAMSSRLRCVAAVKFLWKPEPLLPSPFSTGREIMFRNRKFLSMMRKKYSCAQGFAHHYCCPAGKENLHELCCFVCKEAASSVWNCCFQQPGEPGEEVVSAGFTGKQNDLPFEQSTLLILWCLWLGKRGYSSSTLI